MNVFKKSAHLMLALMTIAASPVWSATTWLTWDAGSTTSTGGSGTWSTSAANWTATSGQSTAPTTTPYTNVAWTNSTSANLVEADFRSASELTLGSDVAVSLLYFIGTGAVTINPSSSYTLNMVSSGGSLIWLSSGFYSVATINANMLVTDFSATGTNTFSISSGGSSTGSIVIGGNINITGSTSGVKTLSFDAPGVGQTYTYSGSTTLAPGGTATIGLLFGNTVSNNNGTYILSGNNSAITDVVKVNRGTVVVNNSGALGSGAVTLGVATSTSSNVAAVLMGTSGLTIANSITAVSGSAATNILGGQHTSGVSTFTGGVSVSGGAVTLTQAAGGMTDFSGQIYASSGTYGITKTGAGVVRLTRGAGQSFSGTTVINAGTLLVTNTSGNGVGSGTVTVGTGTSTLAYFGGTGFIGSSVTLNGGGAITPGNINTTTMASTTGAFHLTSGLTWNSDNTNAGMYFQLGTSSDRLDVTGGFTQGTGTDFLFNITDAGGLTVGNTYTLILFDSTTFTSAADFGLDAATLSSGIDGTFILNGSDLSFTVSAIPEPSTTLYLMLIAAFAAGHLAIRRRASAAV